MDSDVKTKYKQEFLTFPNTNPAVMWRRIEKLDMDASLLLAVTLILKVRCIECLFRYVFRYIINSYDSTDTLGSEFTPQDMLDTLKPLCIPVRKAIIWVRCEERPKALSSLDFKDEDLTDIIDLYYKVDFCIRAFPLFINMKKLPEDLMWDFVRTSMIENNETNVNPFGIVDPWSFIFPESVRKLIGRYKNSISIDSMLRNSLAASNASRALKALCTGLHTSVKKKLTLSFCKYSN